MPRHHDQQVLRRVDDKALDDKVKVDLPTPFWNATQGRWDGLHDERPDGSFDLAERQNEGSARNVRGLVRRRKLEREMLAPGKRTPRLLVRFHQLKPAHYGDGTRRSVT